MDVKKYNLINIYHAKKLINLLFDNSNESVLQCYKDRANPIALTVEESLKQMLRSAISELNLEVICLLKECFGKNGLNSTKGVSQMLKDVKKDLPTDFSTMNGDALLKMFRDLVVHNSSSNHHIKDNGNFVLEIPTKVAGTSVNLNVPKIDMIKNLYEYDNARKLDKQFGSLDIKDDYNSLDAMLNAKKKGKKLSEFITDYNEKGEEVAIDEYQDRAFLKFLLKYKKLDYKLKNFNYFKVRFFPKKDNKVNNYELKCRLLTALVAFFTNTNLKMSDIVRLFKDNNDVCGIFCFIDKETAMSIIYSSCCFNMFSSNTNEELFNIFNECDNTITEDQVRHLRNSFVHGRYFYNYKNGFEIYDGTKEMEHITTFTFEQIEKFYEVYAKDIIKKVKEERAKYIINKSSKGNTL